MQSAATNPDQYLAELPDDRKSAVSRLRKVISEHLPAGFTEQMSYGMLGYVVPFEIYPAGYHCDSRLPLPFMNVASQKNFIAVYHMGMYAVPEIYDWFVTEYEKTVPTRLDMGKSCVRMKNMAHIPYTLIGELASKLTVAEWIAIYEKGLKKP